MTLTDGSGVGLGWACWSAYSPLNVLLIAGELNPVVKSWATFGDIGDGVAIPCCMTAVGGVVVEWGH